MHRKPAVVIAPMTREGEIVLIREERVPIRAAIWEVPAGQIDDAQEPKQEEIEATLCANCARKPDMNSPQTER